MTIGEKIIRERKRKDLTQQALSELCGVTKRTIASYETDGRIPHPSTLKRIAQALGCTTDYLVDESIIELKIPTAEQQYIDNLRETYGDSTADEIEELITKSASLFAGGRLEQEAKDKYFLALTNAYIACKRNTEDKR